jgi:hypothetical protein
MTGADLADAPEDADEGGKESGEANGLVEGIEGCDAGDLGIGAGGLVLEVEAKCQRGEDEKRGQPVEAFVFPGQGAQTIGMGARWPRPIRRQRRCSTRSMRPGREAVGADLGGRHRRADPDQNAQPALMATSIAAMRALEAEGVASRMRPFVPGIRWANIRRCARRAR